MKRLFDLFFSLFFILILLPFGIGVSIAIALDSRGGVFFKQIRVGKKGKHFGLYKFRTMRPNSESKGQITVGARDSRITNVGYFLRKYKLDELPQLLNILFGQMSVVGPRPEVPKYVALYTKEQLKVLDVRPGLTDYASLEYFSENELLAASNDPETTYREEIMPAKLALNQRYIGDMSFSTDMKIIIGTIKAILR